MRVLRHFPARFRITAIILLIFGFEASFASTLYRIVSITNDVNDLAVAGYVNDARTAAVSFLDARTGAFNSATWKSGTRFRRGSLRNDHRTHNVCRRSFPRASGGGGPL